MRLKPPYTLRVATLGALLTLVGASGCKSQQTAFTNPFSSAPDRVPPPATRTLLPGQASPYYPGDPLPAMQSATSSAAPQSLASRPAAPAAAPASAPAPAATIPASPASRATLASANEAAVAIPSDGDALRFALPKPAPAPTSPPLNQQVASRPAAVSSPQAVSLASYGQPMANASPVSNIQPVAGNNGPWRSPQIARQSVAPATQSVPLNLGPPPGQPLVLAPPPTQFAPMTVATAPPSSMDVRLRAVPSPPIESAEGSTPRIRIPGFAAPQQPVATSPGAVQQAAYYSSNVTATTNPAQWPPGAVQQTVQITPLAANVYQPTVASLNTGDGFRPRGSMR